jgi:ubiquinone biosynthesis protein
MLPFVRRTRHLNRYRQIVQVLGHHGFGYLLEQLGLTALLSWPWKVFLHMPPPRPIGMAERLCQALIELGPTFVKIGQFLSTRPDMLPPEMMDELEKLQDTVPSYSPTRAIATIEAELGQPVARLFREFQTEPIAAASLGQVHAAVLPDGEQVVVKVQRPDIVELIELDLEIISDLARLAQERTNLGQNYDLIELAWEFSTTLRRELDYNLEYRNAERFRAIFEGNKHIRIPKIYTSYTSTRVLTTERFFGAKITDLEAIHTMGVNPSHLAHTCVALIFHEMVSGFFHADPHPGNFFVLPGGVLGAVDFGQVGVLDRDSSQQIIFLIMAVIQRDTDNALRALEGLGIVERQHVTPAIRRDVHMLIESLTNQPLNEISMHVTGRELFTIVQRHKLTMPAAVASLLKAVIMMEGVGLQLDPSLNVSEVAKPFVQQAVAEQYSLRQMQERLLKRGRTISETFLELPDHVGNLLRRLNDGEVRIQTQEQELRHLAQALIGASHHIGLSIVLASIILGLSVLAVAESLGGPSGTLPATLIAMGTFGALVAVLLLATALLRRGKR